MKRHEASADEENADQRALAAAITASLLSRREEFFRPVTPSTAPLPNLSLFEHGDVGDGSHYYIFTDPDGGWHVRFASPRPDPVPPAPPSSPAPMLTHYKTTTVTAAASAERPAKRDRPARTVTAYRPPLRRPTPYPSSGNG